MEKRNRTPPKEVFSVRMDSQIITSAIIIITSMYTQVFHPCRAEMSEVKKCCEVLEETQFVNERVREDQQKLMGMFTTSTDAYYTYHIDVEAISLSSVSNPIYKPHLSQP